MARLGCGSGSLIIPIIRPNKSCGCITRNPLPAASLMRGERLVPEPVGVSFSVCAADSVKDVHACSSRHGASNLFRIRVLRVFFVAAQFPVDRNYRRGNMKCKARQELCRSDRLVHRDALSALNDRLLHRDPVSHVCARKPFRMRTYEKRTCKPSGICNYKIIGLKVP